MKESQPLRKGVLTLGCCCTFELQLLGLHDNNDTLRLSDPWTKVGWGETSFLPDRKPKSSKKPSGGGSFVDTSPEKRNLLTTRMFC